MVTFLVAEWPWGRGWVVMAMEFGGTVCLPTPALSPVSPGPGEGPVGTGLLGGRRWTSAPRDRRARGEGPRGLRLQVGSKVPLRLVPSAPPHLLRESAHLRPPHLHPPQAPSQALCLCLAVLITALACPYLRLGPQSTWPPGLCPAGSQAAGSAASAAGSCSLPSAGPGPPGPDLRGWLGGCLAVSLSSDLCTFSTWALCPPAVGQGPSPRSRSRPGPHRLALSF